MVVFCMPFNDRLIGYLEMGGRSVAGSAADRGQGDRAAEGTD